MMKKKGVDQRPHSSTRPPVPPPVLPGICQLSLAVAKTLPLFLDDIIYIYYSILCSFLLKYLSQIGNLAAVRHFAPFQSMWILFGRTGGGRGKGSCGECGCHLQKAIKPNQNTLNYFHQSP